jgi:hypothetical protein
MSIPSDYEISEFDKQLLETMSVTLIPLDASIGSGDSFKSSIKTIFHNEGSVDLTVLFGDTLITDPNLPPENSILVGSTNSDLSWGVPESVENDDVIYTGVMRFDLRADLSNTIEENCNFNFPDVFDWLVQSAGLKLQHHDNWFDFGHLATFYQSSAKHLKSRFFNDLYFTESAVKKTSRDTKKINAEIAWYQHLPVNLKVFTPQLFSVKKTTKYSEYSIELLYQPTLAALAVYGSLTTRRWEIIFRSCFKFLKLSKTDDQSDKLYSNLLAKTIKRTSKIDEVIFATVGGKQAHLDLICYLNSKYSKLNSFEISYAHGDFCFSNILFDTRSELIKVIDPRGKATAKPGEFDFVLYDIAKLAHSVLGGYDLIIQNRYNIVNENGTKKLILPDLHTEAWRKMEQAFLSQLSSFDDRLTIGFLKFLCGHLFSSMVPLHCDDQDRQRALLLNAHRLFFEALD